MIVLKETTDTLEVVLDEAIATSQLACKVGWREYTGGTGANYEADRQLSATNSTTEVTIMAAPASGKRRVVDYLSVHNRDLIPHWVTVSFDASGTEYELQRRRLLPGSTLCFIEGAGWSVTSTMSPSVGKFSPFYKIVSVAEAIGYQHSTALSIGYPGQWAVGTPGLAGRATDGTAAADFGCIVIPSPGVGPLYLTDFRVSATVAHFFSVNDYLWVNSGIAVTTTTSQTINSVALPSRDAVGNTLGEGVYIGLLVTTATTNGAAISNSTISYTNQAGTAGRTATLTNQTGGQIPATAVAGTFITFALQAGDTGVRSIQSITLATSLGGGAVSLVMFRPLAMAPALLANVGSPALAQMDPGNLIFAGTCAFAHYIASATSATTIHGGVMIQERAA